MRTHYLFSFLVLGGMTACSSPDLSGSNFQCQVDSDCGSGQVCASLGGELACLAIEDGPIRIGMTGPLQGTSEALGNEMRRGMDAYLKTVNDNDGVFGRQVELTALNDNYNPEDAVEALRELIDVLEVRPDPKPDVLGPNGVFAMVGNIGTPTMLATAPVATKNEVIFFGPFTGSQEYLRDTTNSPFVYNYRAGYFDETASMVDYLSQAAIPRVIVKDESAFEKILVFAQDDSYGSAGYRGVIQAYNSSVEALPNDEAIAQVKYQRENVDSVDPAVIEAGKFLASVLAKHEAAETVTVPIIMIDTYRPANRFIRGLRDLINGDRQMAERLKVLFMNVSFVGGDSLSAALIQSPAQYTDVVTGSMRSYSESVIVTQVVPNYTSQASGVRQYREDIDAFDRKKPSFTSLEGYLVAKLFVDALQANGPNLTTQTFRDTLDSKIKDHDIGIGTLLNFSATNHQASTTVWGSQIESDGSFRLPYVWDKVTGIQSN